MTTSSTAPAKAPPDPLEQLREAEQELEAARAERARLGERARAFGLDVQGKEAELRDARGHRARSSLMMTASR